jgi:cation diffusion facilitator family transporter
MGSVKTDELKEGERAAGISTVVIFFLALAEALVGFLSGSVVLVTDALHNAADSIASFASWFGLKISQRNPTEKFPYGYYKAESLATLFVSIFILYAAYELLLGGYSKLFTLSELTMPFQALGITLVTLIVSFFLAKYMKKVGKNVNSQSLIANSQERTTHVLASAIIFVAIVLTFYKVPYVEGIITIFFSLLVLKIGVFTVKDSVLALMDVSPSREIEERIKKIIEKMPGVESFEDLKLRRAGPFIFGDVKIETKKFLTVKRAHEISENIENKIKKKVSQIDAFNIHVEPSKKEIQKLLVPINNKKGIKSKLSDHFARANYFIFIELDGKKIKSYYFKDNKYKKKKVRAGLFSIENIILKEEVDLLITRQIGAISFHTLRDHLIDVYLAKKDTVGKSVDDFLKDRLNRLTEPTKKLGQEKVARKR